MTGIPENRRSRLSPEQRALLERRLKGRAPSGRSAIPRAPREGIVPLSFAQERLWFLDRLGLGAVYNMASVLRVSGALDAEVLRRSLDAVVARHEVLRTTYVEGDDGPVQRIAPAVRMPLPFVDLSALSAEEQEREVHRIAERESQKQLDLAAGTPLHLVLARLGETEHVLFVTLHHIAGDDWSLQVLLGELFAHHGALQAGRTLELPALPVQYADFAVWQRQRLQGAVLEEHLAYWRRQLEDLPMLNLPLDRPRPATQSFAGRSHVFELPAALTGTLESLARAHGVTTATLLLAFFQVVLSRYAGQDDVVVGSPVANRPHPDLEDVIGLFVSTVVMRSDLSEDPTVAELLRRVHRTTLEAQQHQELPFERLVDELGPERDLSKNPLFQVLFAMQTPPRSGANGQGELVLSGYGLEAATTRFDLELNVRVAAGAILGRFCFNTDILEPATVARMAGHYRTLLEEAEANPTARISELRILDTEERHRVLFEWNATAVNLPRDTTIHGLFERAAARNAQAVAAVCGDERLTYAELDRRADAVACYLRQLGVGPEVLVGVCLERSLDLPVALLGVLKAGGAYVPLDPQYPAERVAFMLADVAAPLVITSHELAEAVPATPAQVICIDTDWPQIVAAADQPRGGAIPADAAAYVIYTSGSTGRPKGVVITHQNATAMLHWAPTVFDSEDLSGVLASTSVCFDLSVFELFVPLAHGGTVILADNALALPALPARDMVRLVNTVPSAIEELLEQDGLPASVRTVNLAGESLKPALVDRIYAAEVARVFDLYGPSEDTTYSTCGLRRPNGPQTIGRPIANEQVYILDGSEEPVPPGVVGELYIGGDGVARGYRNDPAATAERFVPDPFSSRAGARLYRTGDLGRFRAEGNIEFLGRADHQVKLRGYRIEPGEVEVVLLSHDAVCAAAVVPWRIGSSEAQLAGYVVAEPGAELSVESLRTFLLERLPRYMVPGTLVMLESLPMTPNGKLDRKALPMPGARQGGGEEYVAPRTPIEEQLAALWQEVLGVERVGIHDNFFDLGGHSLLATRLFSSVRSRLGLTLPLRTIFVMPTVAGMALEILRLMLEEQGDAVPEDLRSILAGEGAPEQGGGR